MRRNTSTVTSVKLEMVSYQQLLVSFRTFSVTAIEWFFHIGCEVSQQLTYLGRVHIMSWKPFWFAIQLDLQIDCTGRQYCVSHSMTYAHMSHHMH